MRALVAMNKGSVVPIGFMIVPFFIMGVVVDVG
jgi:hypothetical protein